MLARYVLAVYRCPSVRGCLSQVRVLSKRPAHGRTDRPAGFGIKTLIFDLIHCETRALKTKVLPVASL